MAFGDIAGAFINPLTKRIAGGPSTGSPGGPSNDGGGLGGLLGSAKKELLGDPNRTLQLQKYSPEQQDFMSRLLEMAGQNTNFQGIENQARTNFQTQTVPGLAERFQGMRGSNRLSSGVLGALSSAGAGLEENLAGLRSQYGLKQAQLGLQPQYENVFSPTPGFLREIAPLLQALLPLLSGGGLGI